MIDAASGGALVDRTPTVARSLISNMANKRDLVGYARLWGHTTHTCQNVYEGPTEVVNAIGGFPGQLRQQYNPYSKTYNEGWRDYPNFCYGNKQQAAPPRPPGLNYEQKPQAQQAPLSNSKPSIEDLITSLAKNSLRFQRTTEAPLKSLANSIGQMASSTAKIKAKFFERFPSQPIEIPRARANVIMLRSGTSYAPSTPFSSSM
uniref:Uncharacterized protein n=1 Tax=Cannabis sativa TaxID=3483 RepID=A0A803QCA8_CANSA